MKITRRESIKLGVSLGVAATVPAAALGSSVNRAPNSRAGAIYPGADQRTPSYSQFFAWINNTNEGSTEAHTLVNLDFFQWLHDSYGMVLDIYALDAGAIDKAGRYGKMDSDAFRRQFPNGIEPIYRKAEAMGTRLGVWGGPDGFGNGAEEERARIEMMVSLCRDYDFIIFKFDAVVGQLRPEKQDGFARMMTECRQYTPDLILLNHRLNLGEALPHATTYLLGGDETYIDVHMANEQTATHHRAGAIDREVVPGLVRMTEDHGVCLSSCLNYWEDDLILQAFNRNLLLAPQIYGNPWLLADDEYPKLARIFNLARIYREILVDGMELSEENYGEKAVSRGDAKTRLLTLRNLSWEPVRYTIKLDAEIGLIAGNSADEEVEVRQYHPTERLIGRFAQGASVEIDVLPFRTCLLKASLTPGEFALKGCDYEVVRDIPGKPLLVNLLALPGETKAIELVSGDRTFASASLAGQNVQSLVEGKAVRTSFAGKPLKGEFHRKLGDLVLTEVPDDAEALYEATCFAADNNALEVRSLQRSGESQKPQVQKARAAYFEQELFIDRGIRDKNLFDYNDDTAFYVARRVGVKPIERGSFRIDFGEIIELDKLIVRPGSEHALQPFKYDETIRASYSSDLKSWTPVALVADSEIVMNFDQGSELRYVRFYGTPDKVIEVSAYLGNKKLDRSKWRASNLFAHYSRITPQKAWQHSFTLGEIPKNSYLAIALDGEHGIEGAYAAIRVNTNPVGAPDRSVSYPANSWEYPPMKSSSNYTYYIPLSDEMRGAKIDAVVLGLKNGLDRFKPAVWITAYPAPYSEQLLSLVEEA
jgi:hypothetical protein